MSERTRSPGFMKAATVRRCFDRLPTATIFCRAIGNTLTQSRRVIARQVGVIYRGRPCARMRLVRRTAESFQIRNEIRQGRELAPRPVGLIVLASLLLLTGPY